MLNCRLENVVVDKSVLGRARVKPDGAGDEIDLTDVKIEQFTHAPTIVIGSLDHRPEP